MSRATKAQILTVEKQINDTLEIHSYNRRIFVQWANGRPRAHLTIPDSDCHTDISPRLPKREMLTWLEAFLKGVFLGVSITQG